MASFDLAFGHLHALNYYFSVSSIAGLIKFTQQILMASVMALDTKSRLTGVDWLILNAQHVTVI